MKSVALVSVTWPRNLFSFVCTRTHVNIRFCFLTELEENALILMCRADGRTVIMMSHLSPVQLFVHFDFCDSKRTNSAWRGENWLWWTPDGWSPTGCHRLVLHPSLLLSSLLRLSFWPTGAAGAQACRWNCRRCGKSVHPVGRETEGRWWRAADSASRHWKPKHRERRRAEIWETWEEKQGHESQSCGLENKWEDKLRKLLTAVKM